MPALRDADNQTGVQIYGCSHQDCGRGINRAYIENVKIPRASVGLIGFTGHGKTSYIHFLFYLLNFLKTYWSEYFFNTLDKHTNDIVYRGIPWLVRGELPDSTPVIFPAPALIYFHRILVWRFFRQFL